MKGEVTLNERALSPRDRVLYIERKELYTQGAAHYKDSTHYLLWSTGFYIAGLGCLIADLYLPVIFSGIVTVTAFTLHVKSRNKAKAIAFKIVKLEDEIFGRAMEAAIKAFKEYMEDDKATKRKITRKRRTSNRTDGTGTSSIRVGKHGELTEPDNPGWYNPKGK